MIYVKKFVIWSLERLCTLLRHPSACRLANYSDALDQKWQTHSWSNAPKETSNDESR